MKSESESRASVSQSPNNGEEQIGKVKPYKKAILCVHCNQEGHMRFECPHKDRDQIHLHQEDDTSHARSIIQKK